MAKKPRIELTTEQIAAIEDDLFAYCKQLILPQSSPVVVPLKMEQCVFDGSREYADNGAPIWRGYHPLYPGGVKWFNFRLGGLGTVFKVRGVKLWVEIMDIVAEINEQAPFQWQWSIKLVKHIRGGN